jgi:translation initiation factor 2-alpha kinase 4
MTHIHIVRYYQAWVEGGSETSEVGPIQEEVEINAKDPNADQESSSTDNSEAGFWTNSPVEDGPLSRMKHILPSDSSFSQQQSSSESSSEMEDNDVFSDDSGNDSIDNIENSMENLFDNEYDLMVQSPLLNGLGFQNQMYQSLYGAKNSSNKNESSAEDDAATWDESSVKINSKSGKTILYIQMEYCSTTLREFIDNQRIRKMTENDRWRLVRQILEALSYLHHRNIIHRDLVRFLDAVFHYNLST